MSTSSRPVALVTGAARRLGKAIAIALDARGYTVAIHHGRSDEEARELAATLGHGAHPFGADLADPDAPDALVQQVHAHFGRLDLLVNSAATFERTPLATLTTAQWDQAFAVNLRAPFFLSRAAARVMPAGSSIINLSDLAGFEQWTGYIPHGLSKGGVAEMTRALAKVLAPGIRVNAIAPGVVLLPDDFPADESERLRQSTPLARHGTPDDVVRAVTYLLDAGFVTGTVLFVDGGRHVRH